MDVRDYLLILESVKQYKLPEQAEFRLMKLPFDVGDMELMGCFLDYVDEYFIKRLPALSRPKPSGHLLFELEKYYQKLGLYYAFSKNFDIGFDPDWVYKERERTSERINKLLVRL